MSGFSLFRKNKTRSSTDKKGFSRDTYGEFGPGGYFANSDDFRLKLEGDMPLDGGSTHSSPFDHLGDPLDPPNNKKKVIAKVV